MYPLLEFDDRLEIVLFEAFEKKNWRAAVGIVQCGDKFLLGLAKNKDDRLNKWVCPGGGVKRKENPEAAAVREVWEETGIRCKAVGEAFSLVDKKDVAFVHCKAKSGQTFNNNHEFAAVGWFRRGEMKGLKLYHNVLKLVDRII